MQFMIVEQIDKCLKNVSRNNIQLQIILEVIAWSEEHLDVDQRYHRTVD